ncbi:hypothetical protein BJ166DRAFT_103048 [Pestalotiopsis sp. NC0098]|nr:hypothetical protein BJ166DRAFT_103048 [Pestalotiopsis sp. NC0098]
MALTIKHLNGDASFLLSFEPINPSSDGTAPPPPPPFTVLLDPWLTGPSNIFHRRFSTTTQKVAPCVASLAELPAAPDLVIVSQAKSDHCNEATLRQLPASGTRTLILAEPASARLIRSWKYFDRDKVRTIDAWRDPRGRAGGGGGGNVLRVPVPAVSPGGQPGEVTVSWIPQKRDMSGLHGAIGITYRPPSALGPGAALSSHPVVTDLVPTPPATPVVPDRPPRRRQMMMAAAAASTTNVHLFPPSPPVSPHSLRSVQSAAALSPSSPSRHLTPPAAGSRPLSLVFSPHGISYADLSPWATSHLVAEAALPLSALLHCMDGIRNPWWLGGDICSGGGAGAETAARLGARVWVSAHDADKDVRGLGTGLLRTRRWGRKEIVAGILEGGGRGGGAGDVEILRLGSGEEVLVTGEGLVLAASSTETKR